MNTKPIHPLTFQMAQGAVARTLGKCHAHVVFSGKTAYTDMKGRINLPAMDMEHPVEPGHADIMRGYCDHEFGHDLHTDRDVYFEAAERNEYYKALLNCVEDMRIERCQKLLYPGTFDHITATVDHTMADLVRQHDDGMLDLGHDLHTMPVALTWLGRKRAGHTMEHFDAVWSQLSPNLRSFVEWGCDLMDQKLRLVDETTGDGKVNTKTAVAVADAIYDKWESVISERKQQEEKDKSDQGDIDGVNDKNENEDDKGDLAESDHEGVGANDLDGNTETDEGDEKAGDEKTAGDEPDERGDETKPGEDADAGKEDDDAKVESEENEGRRSGKNDQNTIQETTEGVHENKKKGNEDGGWGYPSVGSIDDVGDVKPVDPNLTLKGLDRIYQNAHDGHLPYIVATNEFDFVLHHDRLETIDGTRLAIRGTNPMVLKTGMEQYQSDLSNLSHIVKRLARHLERDLMSIKRIRYDGGRTEGRLDPRRLVPASIGRDDVFRQRVESPALNTAVTILVDRSGSMNGPRAEMAYMTTIALMEAIAGFPISLEILGWNSGITWFDTLKPVMPGIDPNSNYGSLNMTIEDRLRKLMNSLEAFSRIHPQQYYVYKTFNQSHRQVRAHIPAMKQKTVAGNVDGEAVDWAYRRLLKRAEPRKLLIVISDGQPCNSYHENSKTMTAGSHLEIVAKRIETDNKATLMAIGIANPQVCQFYSNHCSINNINQLPEMFFDMIGGRLIGDRR